MATLVQVPVPTTPSRSNGSHGLQQDEDDFSSDNEVNSANLAHHHRFSRHVEPFDLSNATSPSQLKRTIEAHLQETDRRLLDTQHLGESLLKQRDDLTSRLEQVEQFQDEATIPPDLRRRLADIEKEHADVGREVAKALLGPKQDDLQQAESGVFTSQATGSPTKVSAPSRRHRNQPSTRAGDLQFAADISTSLLAQVRHLQSAVTERDEALRRTQAERESLENDLLAYNQKIRALDESEQRFKDENWNLETQKHELLNSVKDAGDREKRLNAGLNAAVSEKSRLQSELDDLKSAHTKLAEEHVATRKAHDTELHGLKRSVDAADTDRQTLQEKVNELISQNQELARAAATRSRSRQISPGQAFLDVQEPTSERVDTPDDSPPPSPTKATPRHGGLESETLRSSLHHAHRMIQNLKGNIHREKTEKIELKRMLQDARDELEQRRGSDSSSAAKRQKIRAEAFKKPARPDMLGNTRRSRTDVEMADDDWEDHYPDSPTNLRPPPRGLEERHSDMSDAYQTANDTEGTFDTADERNTTESEAFMTGAESLAGDSTDELTETEDNISKSGRSAPGRVARSSILPRSSADKSANINTASISDDESGSLRTPMQPGFARFKLRNNRASVNRPGQLMETATPESLRSQSISHDSPATVIATQSPSTGEQSLFAELGGMDEINSETHSTPARSSTMSSAQSTPGYAYTPSKSVSAFNISQTRPVMVDSATMTDDLVNGLSTTSDIDTLDKETHITRPSTERTLLPSAFPLPPSVSASPERRIDSSTQYTPQRSLIESPTRPTSSHITPPKTVWDPESDSTEVTTSPPKRLAFSRVMSQDSTPILTPDVTANLEKQLQELQENLSRREEEIKALGASHAAVLASMRAETDQMRDSHSKELGLSKNQIVDHEDDIKRRQAELEILRSDHLTALGNLQIESDQLKALHASDVDYLKRQISGHEESLKTKHHESEHQQKIHAAALAAGYAELESLRDSHAKELENLHTRISGHETDLASRRVELESLRGAHEAALETHASELQKLESQHSSQIAALQAQVENHNRSLLARQVEIDAANRAHTENIDKLNREIILNQTNLGSREAELERTRSSHVVALAAKDTELEATQTKHLSEIERLKDAVAGQNAELDKKRSEIDSLGSLHSQELAALKAQISGQSQEIGSKQTELEKLQSIHNTELGNLKRQIAGHIEEVTAKQTELESLRHSHAEEKLQYEKRVAENMHELEIGKAELQQVRSTHTKELERLQADAALQEQDIKSKSLELSSLTSANVDQATRLATTLAALQAAKDSHDKDTVTFSDQVAARSTEVTQMRQELDRLRNSHHEETLALRGEIETLRSGHDEQLRLKQAEIESVHDARRDDLLTHQMQKDELHDVHQRELLAKIAALDELRSSHQHELASKNTDLATLQQSHQRELTAKNLELQTLQGSHQSALAGKDDDLKGLMDLHQHEMTSRDSRENDIRATHAVLLSQKQAELDKMISAHDRVLSLKTTELDTLHSAHQAELESYKAQLSNNTNKTAQLEGQHAKALEQINLALLEKSEEARILAEHLSSLQLRHKSLEARLSNRPAFSGIMSQETYPTADSPALREFAPIAGGSTTPERPRTAERIVGSGLLASAAGYGLGQNSPKARDADDVFGGPLSNVRHDQVPQTMSTTDQADAALRSKRAVLPPVTMPVRSRSPGIHGQGSPTRYPGKSHSRNRSDVSPIEEDPRAGPSSPPMRPGSASSTRASSFLSQSHPPLPSDHRDVIARANSQLGSPTRRDQSTVKQGGTMGPPVMPASAMRRSNTPTESVRTASRVGQNGKRGILGSQTSRRSSVSSFASELDERFNIRTDQQIGNSGFEAGPGTDPRMIQAITQTMIGEFLWKYTRKAGSKEMSTTRHRRYFWVHPYTKTLYWSESDPQTAGRSELKVKSVQIESVRVVSDDNPMPPGLHRKSLEVTTPGRKVRFTASTGQRHETWFNALSYLLNRGDDKDQIGVDTASQNDITQEDIAEFSVNGYGARLVPNDRMSMSSYNSRTTNGTSRRVRQSLPLGGTIPSTQPSQTQVGQANNDTTRASRLDVPPVDKDRTLRASSRTRISRMLGSVGSRSRAETPTQTAGPSQTREGSSIYNASVVSDGRHEEEEETRRRQAQEENPGLEDVRACCDGMFVDSKYMSLLTLSQESITSVH